MTHSVTKTPLVKGYHILNHHLLLNKLQWLIGLPVHLILFLFYQFGKEKKSEREAFRSTYLEHKTNKLSDWQTQFETAYDNKDTYFGRPVTVKRKNRFINQKINRKLIEETNRTLSDRGIDKKTYHDFAATYLADSRFIIFTLLIGFPFYLLLCIYQAPIVRFIFERLIATIFVILSVIVIVFSILYFSPQDAAANILGEHATRDQILNFNQQHGLDQPYFIQLTQAMRGFITFDLGQSFSGNEVIATSIMNRFPVTLVLAFFSLLLAVVIAIPIGIISAYKVNSFWDYSFMFIALIGLSIPSFWQGLIFILTFSLNLGFFPSSYVPGDFTSLIMPITVLGTAFTAAIARMTRSAMLEVMHEDYMITAKAKGLSKRYVLIKHGLSNAWIPIVTVIGLQFGVMLGGAAVTEKVFNIRGLGSYIVDKQFVPDTPAILAGVVYIAIAISLVNLVVDLLYALLNPRIRTQLKQ